MLAGGTGTHFLQPSWAGCRPVATRMRHAAGSSSWLLASTSACSSAPAARCRGTTHRLVLQTGDMSRTAAGFPRLVSRLALLERAGNCRQSRRAGDAHGPPTSTAWLAPSRQSARYRACARNWDRRPTLVFAGRTTRSPAPAHGRLIAASIARGRLVSLPAVRLSGVGPRRAFERSELSQRRPVHIVARASAQGRHGQTRRFIWTWY